MKTRFAIAVLLILALAVPATMLAQQSKAEQEVRAAIAEIQQCQLNKDVSITVATLNKYMAPEYLRITATGAIFTKPEVLDGHKNGKTKVEKLEFSDIKVHVYGKTAVATGVSTSEGRLMGESNTQQTRWTRVFVKRGGVWQNVLYQSTKVADAHLKGDAKSAASSELTPTGKLRLGTVGIEVVGGVAVPVGRFFADRLGVPFEPVVYPNGGAWAESFGKGEWDIAIGPPAVAPSEKSDVITDLWIMDLIYLAAPGSRLTDRGLVDQPGVKIGAIQFSPSEKYLMRTLKSAELVRITLSPNIVADSISLLRSGKVDLVGADAGVVYAAAEGLPGATILPGAFTTAPQALVVPKGYSATDQAKLSELALEAKRTGVVQKAFEARGLKGVRVAPE